jgi:hypothetical protein
MSKAEQQQLRRLWGDLASDGRTEEQATHVPDWVNPVLRNAAWQPLSSKPSIDTSDVSSLDQENFKRVVTQRLKKGSIIRVPVASEWGERDLQETFEKVRSPRTLTHPDPHPSRQQPSKGCPVTSPSLDGMARSGVRPT